MAETILQNIETALNNLSLRYVTFTEDETKTANELKDFDIELNDFMDRYAKLKGIQGYLTVEQMNDKMSDFQILYDDIENKVLSGFFKGSTGLKGDAGDQGDQGIEGLKGDAGDHGSDGIGVYALAVSNGFVGSESEFLASLKGANGDSSLLENIPILSVTGLNDILSSLSTSLFDLNGVPTSIVVINSKLDYILENLGYVLSLVPPKPSGSTPIIFDANSTFVFDFTKNIVTAWYLAREVGNSFELTVLTDFEIATSSLFTITFNGEYYEVSGSGSADLLALGYTMQVQVTATDDFSLIFNIQISFENNLYQVPFNMRLSSSVYGDLTSGSFVSWAG